MRPGRRAALAGLGVAAALAAGLVVGLDDDPVPSSSRSPASGASVETSTTAPPITGAPGSAGVGDPYFPFLGNGGYDVARYHLALDWQPERSAISGVTTIDAVATEDLSRFNLDLVGLKVSSVAVDGEPSGFAQVERELEISPASSLRAGSAFTVVVTYAGVPRPVSDGTELFEVGWQTHGREAFVVAEPGGASTFFPVNDHPSDKATYRFDVSAPADLVVAANGLLQHTTEADGGRRTWTYEASDPMASYLVQIAIGDLELVDEGVVNGVRIRHALHRSTAAQAKVTLSRTAEMIDVLDDVYGPYPFEAYGVVAVGEPLGFALETQTLTIVGTDIATRGRGSDLIMLHELAHQWVGNAVSAATWRDIWLNEGFATYSEWIWSERTGGRTAAQAARAAASIRGLATPPGDPGPAELFSPTVYQRGAMALQALRETIGDDAFFTVLRRWVEEGSGGAASTADLIALGEEVAGRPLDDLFQRWIYTPGLPTLP